MVKFLVRYLRHERILICESAMIQHSLTKNFIHCRWPCVLDYRVGFDSAELNLTKASQFILPFTTNFALNSMVNLFTI